MKNLFFILALSAEVLLLGCNSEVIPASQKPVLPVLPDGWKEVLGEPNWRLQWLDETGDWQKADLEPGEETPALSLPFEWTTAVLAWPFWPGRELRAGMMRPSGALFPWDSDGSRLVLSWRGGVDAVFWKELAASERETEKEEGRIPWLFDWPRFRELMESEELSEEVRLNPWLVDWEGAARKTVASGFDRRRIVSMKFTELELSGLGGFWVHSSPFAPPLEAEPSGPLIIMAADAVDTMVSMEGVLQYSSAGWVLIPR